MIAFAETYYPPTPVPCLFIGGPLDGRVEEFMELRPQMEAAKPMRRSVFDPDEACPDPMWEKVTYTAFCFAVAADDHPDFVFYAVEPLKPVHIMQRLWANYAKTGVVAGRKP